MSIQSWRRRAVCVSVPLSVFFPSTERDPRGRLSPQARTALAVCERCPVAADCLADEMRYPIEDQHGIRGGLLASQRRELLQARRREGTYAPVTVAARTRRELTRRAKYAGPPAVDLVVPASPPVGPPAPEPPKVSRYHYGARPYRSRRRTGRCVRCSEERRLVARGLCGACYERLRRDRKHVAYATRQSSPDTPSAVA